MKTTAYSLADGWDGTIYVNVERANEQGDLELVCRTSLRPGTKTISSDGFYKKFLEEGKADKCPTGYTIEVDGRLCRVYENGHDRYLFTECKGERLSISLSLINFED